MKNIEIFNLAFKKATPIEFNPNWKNSTGYLDGVCKERYCERLIGGETRSFIDDFGRPGVIVGTLMGNLVVFKRYSNPESDIFVFNETMELASLRLPISDRALGNDDLKFFLGYEPECLPNVGVFLANVKAKLCKQDA